MGHIQAWHFRRGGQGWASWRAARMPQRLLSPRRLWCAQHPPSFEWHIIMEYCDRGSFSRALANMKFHEVGGWVAGCMHAHRKSRARSAAAIPPHV